MSDSNQAASTISHLSAQFKRLGDEITQLFNARFDLLKIEGKNDVVAGLRCGGLIIGGGTIAAFGCLLVSVAAACYVAKLFGAGNVVDSLTMPLVVGRDKPLLYGAGLVLVGMLCLLIGGGVGIIALGLVRERTPLRRSVNELRKDRQSIKSFEP